MNRENREEAKSLVLEAKQALEQWKLSYFEIRAELENLGRAPRWEFDCKRLFERSDYMASVCQDLCNVFQVGVLCATLTLPEKILTTCTVIKLLNVYLIEVTWVCVF